MSKGFKFVPTAEKKKKKRPKLKTELNESGRNLRFKWYFRNDERPFVTDRFRPKSSFNPTNKDVNIETYLSCLEERLLDIEIPSRFNNYTNGRLYSLKDDSCIIIEGTDKGSVVVVWYREHYLNEVFRQLNDKEVYERGSVGSPKGPQCPSQ